MDVLKTAVTPHLTLEVDEKKYLVEFPLPAVITAEEKIGRSLKSPADWFCAPAKDVPALLEAGLSRHHPDVTAEDIQAICDRLNPEAYAEVTEALGALAFPRFTARYKENLEKLQAKGQSPKAESADAL
jgi:hypothetical protein